MPSFINLVEVLPENLLADELNRFVVVAFGQRARDKAHSGPSKPEIQDRKQAERRQREREHSEVGGGDPAIDDRNSHRGSEQRNELAGDL